MQAVRDRPDVRGVSGGVREIGDSGGVLHVFGHCISEDRAL